MSHAVLNSSSMHEQKHTRDLKPPYCLSPSHTRMSGLARSSQYRSIIKHGRIHENPNVSKTWSNLATHAPNQIARVGAYSSDRMCIWLPLAKARPSIETRQNPRTLKSQSRKTETGKTSKSNILSLDSEPINQLNPETHKHQPSEIPRSTQPRNSTAKP